jgi:tRNA (guanine-N7-)-methyltransferase
MDEESIGNHLIRLRNGEDLDDGLHNQYLFQAIGLTDTLYTLPELRISQNRVFPNPLSPLVMEIGCYMGETVVELASNNTGINILGVDIKYKRVVKSSKRIKKEGLSNAKIAMADALQLLSIFPDLSVKGILIFFPDPWQKHKHKKHRYLGNDFFKLAYKKLTRNGFIWLKSDNKTYIKNILIQIKKNNYLLAKNKPDILIRYDYKTYFEQLSLKENQPVYQLILNK